MNNVVVVSACRTPIGSFNGSLSSISPVDLGTLVTKNALLRANVDISNVDEIIVGCVLGAGFGQNIARQIAINSGGPFTLPAFTVNKVCGSSMKALILASQSIMLGDNEIVVVVGTESMSLAPYILPNVRKGLKMGSSQIVDSMIFDGLTDIFSQKHMGVTAENIASHYNISRKEQDEFAASSQVKAENAIKNDRFVAEIVPVQVQIKKNETLTVSQDEFPRFGTTVEKLSALRPAFIPDGTVTAGNSSGINDGAAALVLMSESRAKDLGLTPMAKVLSYGIGGVDPGMMGLGPIPATKKALSRTNLLIENMDLIEANEAFASQSIAVARELGFNDEILNVNGGAIALGHPIGASGARIVVTLLHEMHKRDSNLGLATLCIGGGMGTAMIFER